MKRGILLLIMTICLFTQCKKDDQKATPDTAAGVSTAPAGTDFVITGSPYIYSQLTFIATLPQQTRKLSWYFGNGSQKETDGNMTMYAYPRIGNYMVTMVLNEDSKSFVAKPLSITLGAERLAGKSSFALATYKYHKDQGPGAGVNVNAEIDMTVSGDSLVTMGAYKELPIKGPHNLFNTAKDSLSYRSKDADSRIHLYYTPVEDVLRLDIEQMVGDTIYKASGTAPFTRK